MLEGKHKGGTPKPRKKRTISCSVTSLLLLAVVAISYSKASSSMDFCNDPANFIANTTDNGPMILELSQENDRVYEEELQDLLEKQENGTATKEDYKEMMNRVVFEVPKDQFGWSWHRSYRANGLAFCGELVGFVWEELPEPSKNLNKRHELEHLLQCLDSDREYFMDSIEWDANLPAFKEYPLGMFTELWVVMTHEDRRCRPWSVEVPEMLRYLGLD